MRFFLPDMRTRSVVTEYMDDPGVDARLLYRTLSQFKLINILFSRIRHILTSTVVSDMKQHACRCYSILDLGSGGCDIPIWLLKLCRKLGITTQITCVDNDLKVVQFARRTCKNFPEIEVICDSAEHVLSNPGRFDYILANHFLHHAPGREIPMLLGSMFEACREGFVVNDILRSPFAYFGFSILSPILFHNSFAIVDGRTSILKGFTYQEICVYLKDAHIEEHATVQTLSPSHIYIWCRK